MSGLIGIDSILVNFSMEPNKDVGEGACYLVLTFATMGLTCALALAGVILLINFPLSEVDATVLTWLIIALCISLTVLISALYLQFCLWKYGKLVLAILYTIFDAFLLAAGVTILVSSGGIISYIGTFWTKDPNGPIVQFIEDSLQCCAFDVLPDNKYCDTNIPRCYTILSDTFGRYSNIVGGVFVGLFAALLVGVVVSYKRALKKPTVHEIEQEERKAQWSEPLNDDGTVWF
jgi:hypothetical protein